MSFIHALILGIVEGLTEFVPVSSTGHLILTSALLGLTDETVKVFEIFIQLGAVLAVVAAYPGRFKSFLTFNSAVPFSGLRALTLLFLTCLPAVILGLIAHDFIKEHLFNTVTVSLALIAGGVWILVIEKLALKPKRLNLDELTWREALAVGFFQCLSLWPGISRAGATILGGMMSGVERKTATEYSFFAAVPIMLAATGYDLLKNLDILRWTDLPVFLTGFVSAFVTAWIVVRLFIGFLARHTLSVFGWYRIALAAGFLLFFR